MKEFDELWKFVTRNGQIVQERSELEHIYNLMKDCNCTNYLEIGTAEGSSLCVLSGAMQNIGVMHYVDLGEPHTLQARHEATDKIKETNPSLHVHGYLGDSTNPATFPHRTGFMQRGYDCVLIDGGHDFATVLSDSILYAPLAVKYIFWHDVQLPEVKAAIEWFCHRWKLGKYSTFINSENYGYAIVEVNQ